MDTESSYPRQDFMNWVHSQPDITGRHGFFSLTAMMNRVDFGQLTSGLDRQEIQELFRLAVEVYDAVYDYRRDHDLLGVHAGTGFACSSLIGRNFFIALMTGSAAKHAAMSNPQPEVVELGMGTGLNCIAGLLINPGCHATAFETDGYCLDMGQNLLRSFGLASKVDIRGEDFLRADLSGLDPDVVVIEHFNDNLTAEPQFSAVNTVHPCKPTTLFVPGGVEIFLEGDVFEPQPYYVYGKSVPFSSPVPDPLVIERRMKPTAFDQLPPTVFIQYQTAILDHQGRTVQFPYDRSRMLVYDRVGNLVPVYPGIAPTFLYDLNLSEKRGFATQDYPKDPETPINRGVLTIDYIRRDVTFGLYS